MKFATFKTQARGIKFYDVKEIQIGQTLNCILEPNNPYDSNCNALCLNNGQMLGHHAKEAANYLPPLLRSLDVEAIG